MGQKNIFVTSKIKSTHKAEIRWLTFNPRVKKWIKVRNVPAPVKRTQGRQYVLEQAMYFDILRQAPQRFDLYCRATLTYATQSFNLWRSQNLYHNGTFFPGRKLSQRMTHRKITIKVNRKQEFFFAVIIF